MRREPILTILTLLALSFPSHAQSEWQWRHPGPEWSRYNGFSVTDSAIYLTGQGAVSISSNALDWTYIPTRPHLTINSIAQSPTEFIAIGLTENAHPPLLRHNTPRLKCWAARGLKRPPQLE